ncbi:MAG: vitamin K epoxide reductase family protein [bacterium]|nr:vitamin K epoxide reductase family protein [bacterium]
MPQVSKWLLVTFIVFSFLGFLDATFLTIQHYQQGIAPCYVFTGCDEVLYSEYSTIIGVPVALLGAIYYLFILITSIFYFDTGRSFALKIMAYVPILGFLASLGFVYLQLFVIQAICFYCMLSATLSTLLFILGILFMLKLKRVEAD